MLDAIQSLDGAVMLWVQEVLRSDALSAILSFYTRLSDHGELWIGLCLLALCFPKARKAGAMGLVALLLGHVVTSEILKEIIRRPRPFLSVEGLVPLIEPPASFSFPSGHSCASFAAAGALCRGLGEGDWWPRWRSGVLLAMAGLMAFSRVYLGVHYLTDVIAGSLVGWGCSLLALRWAGPAYDRLMAGRREG